MDNTETEKTAAQTAEDRNARRTNRYSEDPDYRAKQRARSRKAYRDRADPRLFDPRENLPKMADFGDTRETNLPVGTVSRWVFTKTEVAEIFGRAPKMFYRWVNEGRFPKPVLTATDYPITRNYKNKKDVRVPQTVDVYTVEEVRAAITALGPHLSTVSYYRKDHDTLRRALFSAVREARKGLNLPELAPDQ
jgi:hypothetical protein